MPDYQKGKVYAIRSPHTDDEYIGSTILKLCQRMSGHRRDAKREVKCNSRLIIEAGDAYIELIEEYPCDNIEQLRRREGEIIRSRPNCINSYVAGRTKKEYVEENKELVKERTRAYRQKERARELAKKRYSAYYEKNKEKICLRNKENRRRAKSASEAEQKENE